MYQSIGQIKYSPNSHLGEPKKWAILMCDDGVSEFYRYLFHKEFPYYGKLIKPVWGAHISFIRNEKVNSLKWGLDQNKIIKFNYISGVKTNGKYFWLNVKCPYLLKLRKQYGLSKYPKYGLHLTIGILQK